MSATASLLEYLLAQSLLEEARQIEDRAWSLDGATSFEPAVAATERRMRAEFVESTARRRVGLTERTDHMSAIAEPITIEDLRREREALVTAQSDAKGAARGVITRQIRQLDRQIEAGEPDQAPEPGDEPERPETHVVNLDEQSLEETIAEPAAPQKPTVPDEVIEGATSNVASILRDGDKVDKATLVEAVVTDCVASYKDGALDGGPSITDFTLLGDAVVEYGLLKAYTDKWVGKWLGAGPAKKARKRFDELTAPDAPDAPPAADGDTVADAPEQVAEEGEES